MDVHELCSEFASTKGLSLELDVAPDVPARPRGDAGRVRQILGNLAGNAVKFTDLAGCASSSRRDEAVLAVCGRYRWQW